MENNLFLKRSLIFSKFFTVVDMNKYCSIVTKYDQASKHDWEAILEPQPREIDETLFLYGH